MVPFVLSVALAACAASPARACDFAALEGAVNDASGALRRIRTETDLDIARRHAGRYRSALESAAATSSGCEFAGARGAFDDAATLAGEAQDVSEPAMFGSLLKRSIDRFNAAVMAVNKRQ